MVRFLVLCAAIVLGWPALADACCNIRRVVKQEVVVQPAVVATFAAVPYYIPAYSVGYAAPAPAYQAQEAVGADTDLPPTETPCDKQLAELKARLQALESKAGIQLKAPGSSIIVTKCSQCHDSTTAKGKGKGFVLCDKGKMVTLTPEQRLKSIKKVKDGEMPKDGTLNDDELTEIIGILAD